MKFIAFRYKFFAVLEAVFLVSNVAATFVSILKTPPSCSKEMIEQRVRLREPQMCWLVQEKGYIRACSFAYNQSTGKVLVDVFTYGGHYISDKLTRVIRLSDGRVIHCFSSDVNRSQEELERLCGRLFSLDCPVACPVDKRLRLFAQSPTVIKVIDVKEKICQSRVLFYTGAGISAGCVPTMAQIFSETGLRVLYEKPRCHDKIDLFFADLLSSFAPINRYMEKFFYACCHENPTGAHNALTHISKEYNWGIATENVDFLHQRAGLDVVCRERLGKITDEEIEALDYIVTVGLASDESGFLCRCKSINPHVKIIAFDLTQPSYLSSDDFLIIGDIQVTVPKLATLLLGK